MAQVKEVAALPDFTGSWTLRTSEKLDEYLKSEKWGFIMRKAAAAVSAYQRIEQDGKKQIKVHVQNKKGTYEYTAVLDGSDTSYIDMDKDDVVSQSVISECGAMIVERMVKGKEKKEYTTYRYMENGEMRLKIQNKEGKFCIRIFKRDEKK
eukprot:103272_1